MSTELNPVIHVESRLRIMTVLSRLGTQEELSFEKLRTMLDMTPGNLSAHLNKLEQAGYVAISKTFESRKPVTYVRVTPEGEAVFQTYLKNLKELLGQN
ncbi:transcriptional regulator [Bifidobacterium bombi]|uniref:Transcriptional regulator, MarR/emrR family n=1 Tax=Bifidobacterium bombi DSM 19703 TaxID=1341695 RepID=A0A080N1T4_9BIFI|nr:transcriptional regulator [Bifidobacterium bombi]KFF30783.1 transcriptional regulator, MarR/emrR family [Bifidobacterium bombi DSM 19703]